VARTLLRIIDGKIRKELTMRLRNQIELIVAFLFMASCAYAQDVHYNYDRGANFGAYKTYKWVEIPGGSVPDQLVHQDIKRATNEQLRLKGLSEVEDNADLYVGYQVVINLEKSVDLWGTGGGWGGWGGWGPWGGGGLESVHGQTSTVPVGILLIDLYDVGKKQLVWRGDAMKTIDLKKDPAKNYRNLQKVITKLFNNYPPQRTK
jgi:hypothetical protein